MTGAFQGRADEDLNLALIESLAQPCSQRRKQRRVVFNILCTLIVNEIQLVNEGKHLSEGAGCQKAEVCVERLIIPCPDMVVNSIKIWFTGMWVNGIVSWPLYDFR